jgi:hypothetical protein
MTMDSRQKVRTVMPTTAIMMANVRMTAVVMMTTTMMMAKEKGAKLEIQVCRLCLQRLRFRHQRCLYHQCHRQCHSHHQQQQQQQQQQPQQPQEELKVYRRAWQLHRM